MRKGASIVTKLNENEQRLLLDMEDRLKVIEQQVDKSVDEVGVVPYVLILESRYIARKVSAIRHAARGRTLNENGFDGQSLVNLANERYAAAKEVKQIWHFILDPRTRISLPPHMTDEDIRLFE